ncbi:unnamed protein product [Paramecium octaurelia]|uniref:RING-type domain-containing protein n=1 Tax=Paramecium octaurelia TaxID=43137 RepID=A0A8S1SNQ6_PAROT|nr:unnamed protein product [Paramecium octaurelia]
MIFVLLLLISQTNALYSKKLYRTRGLNAIDIDLEKYSDLNQGSTTINIILENNSFSTASPFLAFCYTTNQQTIKSIVSSPEAIKNQIESNKKMCIFDNNALLYQQRVQQIVLSDLVDDGNEQAYNKFSVFKLSNKQFSIYIYSSDDAQYSIILKGSQKGECYNQCNNNGQCMSNEVLFCKCNEGYLDSTCQLLSTVITPPRVVQFQMKKQPSQIVLLFPLRTSSTQLSIEVYSNIGIMAYLGCQFDKNFIPFYQSNSFYQIEISTGIINFKQDDIQDCQNNIKLIRQNLGVEMDNYIVLLLVNDQNQDIKVELKLYLDNNNDDDSGLEIYYILAGALGALIVALLIIICVIYFQRKARRINNGVQNTLNLRSVQNNGTKNKGPRQDNIPVELYEQIIQEYPGLVEISECQICLVEFQKQDLVKLTYCLHLFHSTCIDEWRKRNQTCPFCREDLTKKKVIQQRVEEKIYQLGVVQDDAMHIDEHKLAELQKREQRLKKIQQTSSPDSANGISMKENTPSPFLKGDQITYKGFISVQGQINVETTSLLRRQISDNERVVISITNYPKQKIPLLLICRANNNFEEQPDLQVIQQQNCIADLNSYDFRRPKQQIILDFQEDYKTFMNIIYQEKGSVPFITVYSKSNIDFVLVIAIQQKQSCYMYVYNVSIYLESANKEAFAFEVNVFVKGVFLEMTEKDNFEKDVIYYINAANLEEVSLNFTEKSNFRIGCLAFNPYVYRGEFILDSFLELTKQQQIDCLDETKKVNKQFSINLQPLYVFVVEQDAIYLESQLVDSNQNTILYVVTSIGIFLLVVFMYCCFRFKKSNRRMNNLNTIQIPISQQMPSQNSINKYIPIQKYEEVMKQFPGLSDDQTCQICLEVYKKEDKVRITYCTHFYHAECIDIWINQNENCPTCRSSLTVETLTKFFETQVDNGNQQLNTSEKQRIGEQSHNIIRLLGYNRISGSFNITQQIT